MESDRGGGGQGSWLARKWSHVHESSDYEQTVSWLSSPVGQVVVVLLLVAFAVLLVASAAGLV